MKFAAKLFLLYEKSVQHKKACEAGTKENKTKGFFKEEKIMVVVLKPDTKEEQIENLKVWLSSMGISTHISRGVNHTIVGLVGDTSVVDMDLVRALDIVENVQRIQEPFKNANRKFHNADQVVDIAGVKIGGGNFQIIAGPCSVESEAQVCEIAERVKAAGAGLLRGGAFKPRTSPYAFQGLKGDGLKLLVEAKQLTGLPIVSEIMNAVHIPMFEESVDLVQVGHAMGYAHLVKPMAMAATVAGADGLMIEVHNNPAKALCDGPQSLTPDQFDDVAKQVFQLRPFACKYDY